MKNAEMKVVCFDANDVIATSGWAGTISGVEDNISNNIKFTGTLYNGNDTTFSISGIGDTKWSALVAHDENDNGTGSVKKINGVTWVWNGSKFTQQ